MADYDSELGDQVGTAHIENIQLDKKVNMEARLDRVEACEQSLKCDLPPPTRRYGDSGGSPTLAEDIEDLTLGDPVALQTEPSSQLRARSRRSTRHRRSEDTFDDLAGLVRHLTADREHDAWCAAHPEVFHDNTARAHSHEECEFGRQLIQEKKAFTVEQDLEARETVDMAGNQQNNHFPSFESNGGRQSASPSASTMNGNGANGSVNYMAPLPVGHQQDINFLYSQIQQLTSILAQNREKVGQITRTAEEVARRANGSLNEGESSKENDAARIRELELDLAKANRTIDIYRNEQGENTALIADYENALGIATDQIRNYCCDNSDRYLTQRRHYNGLLQAEKDEHLQSRTERDEWHAKCMQVCEMIRTAYRLRCDEWNEELSVISGLQGEVRILRKCLGMEEEKPEEETGWQYLREVPRRPPTEEAPPS